VIPVAVKEEKPSTQPYLVLPFSVSACAAMQSAVSLRTDTTTLMDALMGAIVGGFILTCWVIYAAIVKDRRGRNALDGHECVAVDAKHVGHAVDSPSPPLTACAAHARRGNIVDADNDGDNDDDRQHHLLADLIGEPADHGGPFGKHPRSHPLKATAPRVHLVRRGIASAASLQPDRRSDDYGDDAGDRHGNGERPQGTIEDAMRGAPVRDDEWPAAIYDSWSDAAEWTSPLPRRTIPGIGDSVIHGPWATHTPRNFVDHERAGGVFPVLPGAINNHNDDDDDGSDSERDACVAAVVDSRTCHTLSTLGGNDEPTGDDGSGVCAREDVARDWQEWDLWCANSNMCASWAPAYKDTLGM